MQFKYQITRADFISGLVAVVYIPLDDPSLPYINMEFHFTAEERAAPHDIKALVIGRIEESAPIEQWERMLHERTLEAHPDFSNLQGLEGLIAAPDLVARSITEAIRANAERRAALAPEQVKKV